MIGIILLISCAHAPSGRLGLVQKVECMRYFEEILTIQSKRESNSENVSKARLRLENGEMSRYEYKITIQTYLETEMELKKAVDPLYNTAYSLGCFNS